MLTKWVNYKNRKLIENIQTAIKHEKMLNLIINSRIENSHNELLVWKIKNKKTDNKEWCKNKGE